MKRMDGSAVPALEDLQAGDERAWGAFFCHFDGLIRSIVGWPRWHFGAHQAEDVAQVIKAGIVQAIGRLQERQSLEAYVKRICFNRCVDMLRKQLREQQRLVALTWEGEDGERSEVEFAAGPEFDPAAALQQEERAALLRSAMGRLDEASRVCLLQFYVEGLTYRQMAERQGVSVNTVGSRLSRCLDRLRELLTRSELNG